MASTCTGPARDGNLFLKEERPSSKGVLSCHPVFAPNDASDFILCRPDAGVTIRHVESFR